AAPSGTPAGPAPGAGASSVVLPLLLLACTAPATPRPGADPGADSAAADSGAPVDTAPERVGDAPVPVDTGLPLEPGQAELTCADALPVDGKVPCTLRITGPDGTVWWDGAAGVGLHGRSSASFPKPQLAVELRDDAGAEAPADLYGMGEEADWLLNGMWIDRALLRNKLAYDLYRELTDEREWAPESVYVELTHNGAYAGLYALVERVDRGDGRLDLPADDGTGATFIVKGDETGIVSNVQYAHWAIVYPSVATDAVTAGVTARLTTVEGYLTYADARMFDEIDLDSAVAFVLIEELVKNNDAFFLSHHAYTRPDGKLGFVPWDLDLTLGQPSYNDNENPGSWIAYRPGGLIGNMGQIAAFRERMVSMWAEWRATELADGEVAARIDAIVAGLGPAVARNFERWPIGDVDFGGTLYVVGSHPEEIARVKAFLAARLAWMDANVGAWSPYAG
ncbi:MAG: CotH kinase family protein, partial [Pseudomonadota bacterium]|nr:CotH kinase family protein [Pseudomonadota bacterium]